MTHFRHLKIYTLRILNTDFMEMFQFFFILGLENFNTFCTLQGKLFLKVWMWGSVNYC